MLKPILLNILCVLWESSSEDSKYYEKDEFQKSQNISYLKVHSTSVSLYLLLRNIRIKYANTNYKLDLL